MEINAFSALALSSLMSLADPTPKPVVSEFELPAISGLWKMKLDNVNLNQQVAQHCQEYYNFGRNGVLTTTSGTERTVGNYRFSYAEEFDLPILAVQTEWDNNAPDCLGNQIDQSGDNFAVFVKLNNRHEPTVMEWCNDFSGQLCYSYLHKVLP